MLHKTKGIVLNFIKYRETSIITKIYTADFGLQTYIVNGVRSAKSKQKIALYQPLTKLDLVVYKKPHADINRLSEVKCSSHYTSIPFDIRKSTLAMFITEILGKALKVEAEDKALFDFIADSLMALDQLEQDFESFHIQFMCRLSTYLGFSILSAEEVFEQVHIHANHTTLARLEKETLDKLISSSYEKAPPSNGKVRRELAMLLVRFYQLHIASFGDVKSLSILTEVLH